MLNEGQKHVSFLNIFLVDLFSQLRYYFDVTVQSIWCFLKTFKFNCIKLSNITINDTMNLRKLHNKSHYVHKYNFFNHFSYFNRSRWPERHIVSWRSCLPKRVDAKTRTDVSDWAHFRVIYQFFSNRYAIYLQYIGMSIWIDSRNTRFCTKLYIHNVSLLNDFQRGFSNIVKDTQ